MPNDKDPKAAAPEKATAPQAGQATPPGTDPQQQGVLSLPRVNVSSTLEETAAWMAMVRDPMQIDSKIPFMLVHQSMKILDFENNMPTPMRIRKAVAFIDSPSFVDYFKTFKLTYQPRLFCHTDEDGMKILSVFDYDLPGQIVKAATEKEPGQITREAPRWNSHTASLALAYHPDYKALRETDGHWFDQQEFALFVEENTHLFKQPDGATMLELAQHLKGHRTATWQRGKRLSNGENKLEFIEEIEGRSAAGDVLVPEYLDINSPMFEGYEPVDYRAAFRWKMDKDDNTIQFSYRLLTKLAERKALEDVKIDLVKQLGQPLYNVANFEGLTSTPRKSS